MSDTSACSYEPNRQSNRRFIKIPTNPWLPYIGDCRALDKYLKSKQGCGWIVPKYLNALLRGVSQVVFANNPLAGLVILVALFWSNVFVGLAATVAATTAILTSVLMRQDPALIMNGLTSYNAVLVGTVTVSLWTPLYGEIVGTKIWGFIILGAALSVFITSGVSNILSSLKISLPALTLPFNLVTLIIFICLMPTIPNKNVNNSVSNNEPVALRRQQRIDTNPSNVHPFNNNFVINTNDKEKLFPINNVSRQVRDTQNNTKTSSGSGGTVKIEKKQNVLDWGQILTGVIVSAGQVFGVNDALGSILIYVGIMVYSPMLMMMSVFGATFGTICGIFFTPGPFEAIYSGIWGYNGILSAASVGGFFIVLTCHSFWNAAVNVVFTVLLQQAFSIAFASLNLPVFTFPFVLSTYFFLSVTTAGTHLPRPDAITYPEMHRYNYREASRIKNLERIDKLGADEIADEKELVLTDVKVINADTTVVQVEASSSGNDEKAVKDESKDS